MFDFFDSSTVALIISVFVLIDAIHRRKNKRKIEELENELERLKK